MTYHYPEPPRNQSIPPIIATVVLLLSLGLCIIFGIVQEVNRPPPPLPPQPTTNSQYLIDTVSRDALMGQFSAQAMLCKWIDSHPNAEIVDVEFMFDQYLLIIYKDSGKTEKDN